MTTKAEYLAQRELGASIRQRRQALGMRQVDLAEQVHIWQSQLYRIEAGTEPVPAELLQRIEAVLAEAMKGVANAS